MSTSAIILAAGRGDRIQARRNKLLLPIRGKALISHAVEAFAQIPELDEIIVVVCADERETMRSVVAAIAANCRFVEGGLTRRDSSLAGVRAAKGDVVLIHDGARPFPSPNLIRRVLDKARQEGAAIPVLPITDLLHRVNPSGTIEQDSTIALPALVRAQTPQGFRRRLLLDCLEAAGPEVRDDATAVLQSGASVATVPGEQTNIKITHPEDLAWAQAIAQHIKQAL
jgi:2-C-methyl-D-erythritol 4-phosphate cytidylyltransferase